jgi:hypothetical protein
MLSVFYHLIVTTHLEILKWKVNVVALVKVTTYIAIFQKV